jgi:hypothetical protein
VVVTAVQHFCPDYEEQGKELLTTARAGRLRMMGIPDAGCDPRSIEADELGYAKIGWSRDHARGLVGYPHLTSEHHPAHHLFHDVLVLSEDVITAFPASGPIVKSTRRKPRFHDAPLYPRMAVLVPKGFSIRDAAKQVATDAESHHSTEATLKRLYRGFKKWKA